MLEEKDLQAIAKLIDDRLDVKLDEKLTPINDRLGALESGQLKMQDDLLRVMGRLDKRLKAINEGVDAIQETMVSKSRMEQLEDDVVVLKTAVKMLTQEVAELKKAQ